MKKKHFTEEQIALALHQAERTSVEDITRHLGVSQATFYRWKMKYGGLLPSEVKRLKVMEEENNKLKQLVAELSLDKKMLQDVCMSSGHMRLKRLENRSHKYTA